MSSTSKKNIKINEKIIKRLKEVTLLINKIYGKNNLLEICLFGSYAKGTQKKFSSLDILVILKDSQDRFIDRKIKLEQYLNTDNLEYFPLVDALVYTENELLDLINKKESFIISAIKESILLWSNKKNSYIPVDENKNFIYNTSRYLNLLPNLDEID